VDPLWIVVNLRKLAGYSGLLKRNLQLGASGELLPPAPEWARGQPLRRAGDQGEVQAPTGTATLTVATSRPSEIATGIGDVVFPGAVGVGFARMMLAVLPEMLTVR
jgi:hypothetical protein